MTKRRRVILIGVLVPVTAILFFWLGQKDTIKLPSDTVIPATPIAPAEVPAGFKTGSWVEVLQGQHGLVNVDYEITGPGEGKIGTKLEAGGCAEQNIIFRNITNNPVRLTYIVTWRDSGGGLVDTQKIDTILDPNEDDVLLVGPPRATDLKISAEAN